MSDKSAVPAGEKIGETYTVWVCPECKSEGLEEWFSYCPCCGTLLDWEHTKEEEQKNEQVRTDL